MNRDDAVGLVNYLAELSRNDFTILTWNGLGFDFDILAEESGMFDECTRMATAHVDMMFHVFCKLGYPIGLDRAASGMGTAGNSSSVPQSMVPQYWADERFDEVLDYLSNDVRAPLELAPACEQKRKLVWITQRGRRADMSLESRWLTVESAMRLPEPDTSWMDNPMPRSKFCEWIQVNQ